MVTAVAGLAVLGILGLLLASVAVTVRTVPEVKPDSVDFAGTPFDLRFGERQLVLPGRYTLHVSKAGYEPASLDVEVARADGQEIIVPLQRLPGRVSVDASGIEATLTVDGQPLGAVPGPFELAAGKREVDEGISSTLEKIRARAAGA